MKPRRSRSAGLSLTSKKALHDLMWEDCVSLTLVCCTTAQISPTVIHYQLIHYKEINMVKCRISVFFSIMWCQSNISSLTNTLTVACPYAKSFLCIKKTYIALVIIKYMDHRVYAIFDTHEIWRWLDFQHLLTSGFTTRRWFCFLLFFFPCGCAFKLMFAFFNIQQQLYIFIAN